MEEKTLDRRAQRRRFFWRCLWQYTLLFAAAAAFFVIPYVLAGKSLVNNGDGKMQHIKALDYYGRWLRSIVGRIMQGDFSLPAYSFAFGYGGNVITTLHYYAIGDPLALLSIFFDTAHIAVLYDALILLRMYLSGIAFLLLTIDGLDGFSGNGEWQCPKEQERAEKTCAYLTGGLLYAFCGYALYTSTRHPFFLNPLILFPLVLLGVERTIREKRFKTLVLSVAVSAACNFYFFYMIVLLTVLYVGWRLAALCREGRAGRRKAGESFARIAGGAVLGVMLSGVLFLPVVLAFLGNARSGGGASFPLLYGKEYYAEFLLSLLTPFSGGAWTHFGVTGIGLCAMVLLLCDRKKAIRWKVLVFVMLVLSCVPAGGYLLSGGTYVSNRWTWAAVLLICFLVVYCWESFWKVSGRTLAVLSGVCAAGFAGAVWMTGRTKRLYSISLLLEVLLLAALILLLAWQKKSHSMGRAAFSRALLALAFLSVAGNITCMNRNKGNDNLEGTLPRSAVTDSMLAEEAEQILRENPESGAETLKERFAASPWNTAALAVKAADQTAEEQGVSPDKTRLARYTGHGLTKNDSLPSGMPSVHSYWSIANERIAAYLDDIANITYRSYDYRGMDDRALTTALMGTQYYASGSAAYVPFGYERLEGEDNPLDAVIPVYRNRYTLPFGYTYSGIIPLETYRSMDALQRQEAMLQGIVLDEEDMEAWGDSLEEARVVYDSMDLPFETENPDPRAITLQDDGIHVQQAGAEITLHFSGVPGAETCLYLQNLWYEEGGNKAEIKVSAHCGKKTVTKKTITVLTPEHDWYGGRHSFLANAGYCGENEIPVDSLTLEFSAKGVYRLDSMRVTAQPMEAYCSYVEALSRDGLEQVDFHADEDTFTTSRVDGTISLSQPKVLCFAIPFEKGWHAQVDGEEASLLCGNIMFLALPLDAGSHQITLRYETPGLRSGLAISIAAILILMGGSIRKRRRGGRVYTRERN